MVEKSGEIRKRVLRLIKNTLALGFVLVFLNLLQSELSSLLNYFLQGFAITNLNVLNIITLLFIIYFGYFMLIDTKYFIDRISSRLGAKERHKSKVITYDVASIITLILASQLLAPLLYAISQFGDMGISIPARGPVVVIVMGAGVCVSGLSP